MFVFFKHSWLWRRAKYKADKCFSVSSSDRPEATAIDHRCVCVCDGRRECERFFVISASELDSHQLVAPGPLVLYQRWSSLTKLILALFPSFAELTLDF